MKISLIYTPAFYWWRLSFCLVNTRLEASNYVEISFNYGAATEQDMLASDCSPPQHLRLLKPLAWFFPAAVERPRSVTFTFLWNHPKMGRPRPLFVYFCSFPTTCYGKNWRLHRDSNSDHRKTYKASSLTTRPPSRPTTCNHMNVKLTYI